MSDEILKLARGLTRPLCTGALVGAFIAAVFEGLMPAEALAAAATLALGFWFAERKQRHDNGVDSKSEAPFS